MFLDDSAKERLLKMPVGKRVDSVLYYLLSPYLLGYWTFLQPRHKGQELGDVLFVFKDVCLIFEAKARNKAESASESWIRARLKEGSEQITDNYESLWSGAVPSIRNPWRGEVSWSTLGVKYYHGIIVIMHDSEPYDPRELDPSLFSSAKIPIHVVSLHDISELIKFMNTPWDFVVYWEFRSIFGKEYQLPVHREQSIYWGILREWVKLAKAQGTLYPESRLEEDRDFHAAYTRALMRSGKTDESIKRKTAASYLIDVASGSLMEKADKDAAGKRVGSKSHDTLIRTVEVLVDLSRRRRAEYGTLWLDSARQCISNHIDIRKSGYSPSRNWSYFFHARTGTNLDQKTLLVAAAERMAADNSILVIGLSATADNIIHTYESILSAIEGTNFEEDHNKILDSTSVLIDRPSISYGP